MVNSGFREHDRRYDGESRRPLITQAADGLGRRGFTNGDIEKLIEIGVIGPDERFELIKGEIVPMSPELSRHVKVRTRLWKLFTRTLSDEWFVVSDASLFLTDHIELKPDLHIYPAEIESEDVRGPDVRLAVELSSTTQKRDLEIKVPIYAEHGVPELWVIDLDARQGHIFSHPEGKAYAQTRIAGADETLAAKAFPSVQLKIASLY